MCSYSNTNEYKKYSQNTFGLYLPLSTVKSEIHENYNRNSSDKATEQPSNLNNKKGSNLPNGVNQGSLCTHIHCSGVYQV